MSDLIARPARARALWMFHPSPDQQTQVGAGVFPYKAENGHRHVLANANEGRTPHAGAKTHGNPPFRVAVLHGGPGAAGEVAPVARELAKDMGILEPLQTAATVEGQVEELRQQLLEHARTPATLIGHSWGAWLAWMLAARHPDMVDRLVLVSSGVFEARYAEGLMEARKRRLSEAEQVEVDRLLTQLQAGSGMGKDALLARFGALMSRADGYDPLPEDGPEDGPSDAVRCDAAVFEGVWPRAAQLRADGRLLAMGRAIRCPVVAIHGDYDPAPAAGVREPLFAILDDFTFILLPHCGHTPWRERQAKEEFYQALCKAL